MPFLTKGKTNWKYILIILILAVIVGGGILGYSRYFKKEISSLSKFPEIKKPEKSKIEEETADWVTYKNEEYGFEFKYPKEFAENKFCMARETEGGIEVGRFIYISIEDSKGLNLSEYIDSVFPKEFNIESKENITVGGEEAVKIIYSFSGPGAYGEAVFLLKDKKAYLFEFAYGNNPCVAHKLGIDEFDAFEYIISTFKFLEEETANWKTYRNEKYGFEIKYPSDVNVQDEGYIDYLNGIIITFCGGEYANYCGIQGAAPHSEIYFFKFEKDGAEKDLYSFVFKGGELPWDYWPFGYDPNKRNCKILSITVDGAEGKLWDCNTDLFAFWEREKDNSFYHMNVNFLDEFPKVKTHFRSNALYL